MNRSQARQILRDQFEEAGGLEIYGSHYKNMEALRRRDPIAYDYILDEIQWSQPRTY